MRRLFRLISLIGLAFALVAALSAQAANQEAPPPGRGASAPGRGGPGRRGGFPVAYPNRVENPAMVARGSQLFSANCSFCHGDDARGGSTGPNLIQAKVVLDDHHGNLITPIVHAGFPGRMPKFNLSDSDIADIAAWLHAQPLAAVGTVSNADVLVGNAAAGKTYFDAHCATCHSVTGDMAGIGAKYPAKELQNLIVSGGGGGRGFGRGPRLPPPPPTTVTVRLADGHAVEGKLVHIDAFNVSLTQADGTYRSFNLDGPNPPTVTVHNPLQAHIDMLPRWNDTDIHNLTAYLATLK